MAASIKVLHVVFSLETGGMENGLVNVASALPASEFSVDVCCLERSGEFASRLPWGTRVTVLGKTPGFSPQTVRRLAKVIRQCRPDVVHTHNLGPLIYTALARLLVPAGRLLHGEHGMLPTGADARRHLLLRHILYRFCWKVHTVSGNLRSQLVDLRFPAEKIVAVVNGVDTTRFVPGPKETVRRQLGLPAQGLVAGNVGRLIPSKRHDDLLVAFAQMAPAHPDWRLLVVGGQPAEVELLRHRAAALGIASQVHLAGRQEHLLPYYQAMDLLVLPSLVEGLSNVVLEAMACGVPALQHHACGSHEVITTGQDGVVANLADTHTLGVEMQRLMGVPRDLYRMGERARTKVEQAFSLRRMVEDYAHLYRQACLPVAGHQR